jgi:hypothetical protein
VSSLQIQVQLQLPICGGGTMVHFSILPDNRPQPLNFGHVTPIQTSSTIIRIYLTCAEKMVITCHNKLL